MHIVSLKLCPAIGREVVRRKKEQVFYWKVFTESVSHFLLEIWASIAGCKLFRMILVIFMT